MSERRLSDDTARHAAALLEEAERSRVQTRMFSQAFPGMTIADAYAIQDAWMAMKHASGRRPIGYKIGLTSRAMQLAVGIDEPDSGVLLDDMLFADGATIPKGRFIATRLEVELAFVLGRRLQGPGCTIFDVLRATDFVVPALEILDTRLERLDKATGAGRKVVDTISDNASNAGIVLGGSPFRPDQADLRWIGAACIRNGQIEETGVAAGVLNHPANAVAWLANRLGPMGIALEPGHVILSGSFTRPVEAGPGDVFSVDYGRHGVVNCCFGR